jgi:hypothetical protein
MPRLIGRLDKLEKKLVPAIVPPMLVRVYVTTAGKQAGLSTSTCTRTFSSRALNGRGILTESVVLDGTCDHLTSDQLESFLQSFPIKEEA